MKQWCMLSTVLETGALFLKVQNITIFFHSYRQNQVNEKDVEVTDLQVPSTLA